MTSNKYLVEGNTIVLNNKKTITFDYPINNKEVLEIDGLIIVVLEIPPRINYNNNVFALNINGEIIWRVNFKKEQLFYQRENCSFIGVLLNKEGQLILFNWCDTAFIINPKNGEIQDKYYTK